MRVYIICEAGINHNGDFETAKDLVDVARKAGANAVKFQAFDADTLGRPELAQYEFTIEDFQSIAAYCSYRGIDFIVSPFDVGWIDELEDLIDTIKIPSSKITDYDYLEVCHQTGKKIILSTGLSGMDEIHRALGEFDEKTDLTLLHCTSAYPCEPEDVNMLAMKELMKSGVPVGYSDHTDTGIAAVLAVAMGAVMIEKHITLSRLQIGPDHHMSVEPEEFMGFVWNIRESEKMMGDGVKKVEKGAEEYLWVKEKYNLTK